jgi:hypothetical protein
LLKARAPADADGRARRADGPGSGAKTTSCRSRCSSRPSPPARVRSRCSSPGALERRRSRPRRISDVISHLARPRPAPRRLGQAAQPPCRERSGRGGQPAAPSPAWLAHRRLDNAARCPHYGRSRRPCPAGEAGYCRRAAPAGPARQLSTRRSCQDLPDPRGRPWAGRRRAALGRQDLQRPLADRQRAAPALLARVKPRRSAPGRY